MRQLEIIGHAENGYPGRPPGREAAVAIVGLASFPSADIVSAMKFIISNRAAAFPLA